MHAVGFSPVILVVIEKTCCIHSWFTFDATVAASLMILISTSLPNICCSLFQMSWWLWPGMVRISTPITVWSGTEFKLLQEPNAELRRVLIQGIGYGRICQELEAIALDSWQEYSLLEIAAALEEEPILLLKITCPSTGLIHISRVPPKVESASISDSGGKLGHRSRRIRYSNIKWKVNHIGRMFWVKLAC